MSVAAHQKKKNEKTGKRKAGEERKLLRNRPILKRLRAILLLWFRGLHGVMTIVCVRGVPGVTGTFGKANSHFNPTQTGLGTAPPR